MIQAGKVPSEYLPQVFIFLVFIVLSKFDDLSLRLLFDTEWNFQRNLMISETTKTYVIFNGKRVMALQYLIQTGQERMSQFDF